MQAHEQCIVLYVQPYSVADEKTGKINEGVSVHYLAAADLIPQMRGESKGIKPAKDSLPMDKKDKILQVPALYDITFDMRPGSNGKLEMRLMDADFVSIISVDTK